MRNCKVWFSGDYKTERLKLRCDIQSAFRSVENDLAEIRGASFRSDRPHHIRQVLRPEPRCRLQVIELHFGFDVSLLTLHLGLTFGFGQQWGSSEIHHRRTAAMAIIDCLRRPLDDVHGEFEYRIVPALTCNLDGGRLLRQGRQDRSKSDGNE